MGFLNLKVIKMKTPVKVFGSKGKLEYFAVSFEERSLGSMVHLHIRNIGETEKSINERPYHTYLKCDAPNFAMNLLKRRKI